MYNGSNLISLQSQTAKLLSNLPREYDIGKLQDQAEPSQWARPSYKTQRLGGCITWYDGSGWRPINLRFLWIFWFLFHLAISKF